MGYLEKIEDPGLRDGHAGRSGWIRHNSHTSVRVAFTSIRASVELASLQPYQIPTAPSPPSAVLFPSPVQTYNLLVSVTIFHHRLDMSVSLENT